MRDASRPEPTRPSPGAERPPRRLNGAALAVALGLAALAGVLFWDASRLPEAGGYAGIGPADTPRLVGAGLLLLALWTAWEALRSPAALQGTPTQEVSAILWILAGLALQLLLFRSAGFSVAGGLLFACTAAAFGRRRLWITVPIGVTFAIAVFGVFRMILDLSLPAGPLERLVFGV